MIKRLTTAHRRKRRKSTASNDAVGKRTGKDGDKRKRVDQHTEETYPLWLREQYERAKQTREDS